MINSDELIANVIEGKMAPNTYYDIENPGRMDRNRLACALLSLVGELEILRRNLSIPDGLKNAWERQTSFWLFENCTYAVSRMLAIIRSMLCSCMPEDQVKQILRDMTARSATTARTGSHA